MSNPVKIVWLPSAGNSATIASVQTTTGPGNLVLNPNRTNPTDCQTSYYEFEQVWRTVSVTSSANNSGVGITITGYGTTATAGILQASPSIISETIAGPNAGTVHGAYIYKKIYSITVGGAVTNLSAGFGSSGMTDIVFLNNNRPSWHGAVQCQALNRSALTYGVFRTLETQEYINSGFDNRRLLATTFINTGTTTDVYSGIDYPATGVYAYILTNTGANEHLIFNVLQQGV
jgi:hypothetical protein